MAIYYLNGEFVRDEEAKIHISDLGILRGFGVFDYLRTYQGKPFHLEDHLLRLQHSAEKVGLVLPKTLDEIRDIVVALLEKNGFKESHVKIVATGGISVDQLLPEEKSSLMVMVYPLHALPAHLYTDGIKAITTPLFRPVPEAKTTHYLTAIMALQQARKEGAAEALYVNERKEILESTTSNFFLVKKGVLITSDSDKILRGITREVVLRLFPCTLATIPYTELQTADEAFLTASSKEILPVVQVDGIPIGNGKVGPKTREVMETFQAYALSGKGLK